MFLPPLPEAPIRPGSEAEQEDMVLRQRTRVKEFQAGRAKDPSFTWRTLLLGKNSDKQARLIQAMQDANLPDSVIERTEACSNHVFVYKNTYTGEHRLRHFTCHNRFCLMCQGGYTRQVREQALKLVPKPQHRLSFLTLTQRARPGVELQHAIANILSAFKAVRRSPHWKRRVTGGLYVLEVTHGSGKWWHAHLHTVIDTDFWPLELLRSLWHRACHDTAYLHIEAVEHDRRDFVNRYLSSYLGKQFSDDLYDNPQVLSTFVATMRGRRMIQAFGAWAPTTTMAKATQDITRQRYDADTWKFVGELHEIVHNAEGGNQSARAILTALGFSVIQLRQGAESEIDRFHNSRAPPQPAPDTLPFPSAA